MFFRFGGVGCSCVICLVLCRCCLIVVVKLLFCFVLVSRCNVWLIWVILSIFGVFDKVCWVCWGLFDLIRKVCFFSVLVSVFGVLLVISCLWLRIVS